MTYLAQFFDPGSIAIVGVSRGGFRFGGVRFLSFLKETGFKGSLYPINPKADEILGIKVYPDLTSLPEIPDLAIVCVPAPRVPAVLEECVRIGLRHIHIFSAGFGETGTADGRDLEEQMATIARKGKLMIMGPNCMGPYCPSSGLTAWGEVKGRNGPLGIISQSGGIAQRLNEYACSLGVGVGKGVSFGNATVLDSPDYLEHMAKDREIRVIAMYLEGVRDGERLFQIVREVNAHKPIILLRGGESGAGASTATSHTGSLAGEQGPWEAFVRHTGVIQVRSMSEWVDAIIAFCLLPKPNGKGAFIVCGGGGNSVIYADTCIREGLEIPALSSISMESHRQIVPIAGSIAGNPLDHWQTLEDPECLNRVLDIVYDDNNIDMIIVDRVIPRKVFHMPAKQTRFQETIDFIKEKRYRKPTVFTVESDGGDQDLAAEGAALKAQLGHAGNPAYPSMERAARTLAHFHRYHERFGTYQISKPAQE